MKLSCKYSKLHVKKLIKTFILLLQNAQLKIFDLPAEVIVVALNEIERKYLND